MSEDADLIGTIVEVIENDLLDNLDFLQHANFRGHSNQTILHLAVSNKSLRILSKLSSMHLGIENCKNKFGETALHIAAALGDSAIISILLKLNVDPTIKDNWNRTAADVAIQTGNLSLFASGLLQHEHVTCESKVTNEMPIRQPQVKDLIMADFLRELNEKSQLRDVPASVVVKGIFSEKNESVLGVSSSSVDSIKPDAQSTVRHQPPKATLAISKYMEYPGNIEDLRLKIAEVDNNGDFKYDINGKDMYGLAAVHKAVCWNKVDLLQEILSAPNVDVNLRAGGKNDGYCAIHFGAEEGTLEALKCLLSDPRVDKTGLSQDGRLAVTIAKEKGYDSIVDLLS